MPTSKRLSQLDRQVAMVGPPPLEPLGFRLGRHRTFRRILAGAHGDIVHAVHFQAGIKALAGKFTCNLVVYHTAFCPHPGAVTAEDARFGDGYLELWVRVAKLVPRQKSPLDKVWKRDREPEDRWWPQSEDAEAMAATLREVLDLVVRYGPAWFERNGTEDACRATHERVQARRSRQSASP